MTTCTDSNLTVVLPRNEQPAKTWDAGGQHYERISEQISDAIQHCVDRLNPQPGERILDVATGTGYTARRVRARGARATGIDFSASLIRAARDLDQRGEIYFRVADAEALPFSDGEFDAVISTFGVMFCGNQQQAASELARVCKPGGRLALATWQQTGGVIEMFKLVGRHKPAQPAPAASPFAWGDRDRLEELLGADFEIGIEEATSFYRDKSGAAAWNVFSKGFGPVVSLLESLDDGAANAFREEFEAFHERHRTDAGILVPRPYLITVGTRRS